MPLKRAFLKAVGITFASRRHHIGARVKADGRFEENLIPL
jgi:hypothetical protein